MLSLPSILRPHRAGFEWRSLCHIECPAELAIVSARCLFSLATVEIVCNPAATFCALTEQAHADTWRWAVYGIEDKPLKEGSAASRAFARRDALAMLQFLEQQHVINPASFAQAESAEAAFIPGCPA